MIYSRLAKLSKSHSFFIFGARGTGKTSLIYSRLQNERTKFIDLLDYAIEDRYRIRPDELYHELKLSQALYEWVVIDEIQKLPKLLDIVHRIIESKEFSPPKFVLTGSSARKLKRGGANLLAGRAFVYNLFPLTHLELGSSFQIDDAINWGTLPKIFHCKNNEEKEEFLRSYSLTYLKEEVWAEHLVEDLDSFRKFLEIAALENGKLINYANIARDVGCNEKTIKRYFEILEDTLIGFYLEPYQSSIRKRQSKSPKFYLFDTGVKRALERNLTNLVTPRTFAYGLGFEHFLICEFFRLNDYLRKDCRFSYIRTKDGAEIDLIIEAPGRVVYAVEIKSTDNTQNLDIKNLKNLSQEIPNCKAFVFSQDHHAREENGITFIHWKEGLKVLGFNPVS